MKVSEIVTRIRTLLDDPTVPSESKLITWINDIRQIIARETECITGVHYFPLVANKYSYSLPEKVLKVNRVRIVDEDSDNVIAQKSMQRMRDLDHKQTGIPNMYWLQRTADAENLVFYPTPDESALVNYVGHVVPSLVPLKTVADEGVTVVDIQSSFAGDAWKAFDGDITTFVNFDCTQAPDGYLMVDFGVPVAINRATITADGTHFPFHWRILSSDANIAFNVQTEHVTDAWTTKETRSYDLTEYTNRYWGIQMLSQTGDPAVPANQGLYELKFFTTPDTSYLSGDVTMQLSGDVGFPTDGVVSALGSKFQYFNTRTEPSGSTFPVETFFIDTVEDGIDDTTGQDLPENTPVTLCNVEVTYTVDPTALTSSTDDLERIFSRFPNVLAYYACAQASVTDMDDVSAGITSKMQIFEGKFEQEKQKLVDFVMMNQDQYNTVRDYRNGPVVN